MSERANDRESYCLFLAWFVSFVDAQDEPLDENGRPMPPRIVKRVVDDERHPFTTEYFPTQRKTVTHNGKQWAHDKLWIYNPIDPKSEDYKIYKAKIKVTAPQWCHKGSPSYMKGSAVADP